MLQGSSSLILENTLTVFDNLEFLIRILLSGILGAIIGLERTRRFKEAGIRTHCIIAVSSAAFMIISKYAFLDLSGVAGVQNADPARIAAQIVSGISFLGAGVIFKHNTSIRGLTTAAGMWATSAVGMAIGAGMYWLGLIETASLMIIQLIFHRFPVAGDNLVSQSVSVQMRNDEETRAALDALLQKHQAFPEKTSMSLDGDILHMELELRLAETISCQEAMELLSQNNGIAELTVQGVFRSRT